MEAKEKAKELIDIFNNVVHSNAGSNNFDFESASKECALICVGEMIKNIIWSSDFNGSKRKELEEVKQEINKL